MVPMVALAMESGEQSDCVLVEVIACGLSGEGGVGKRFCTHLTCFVLLNSFQHPFCRNSGGRGRAQQCGGVTLEAKLRVGGEMDPETSSG